MFGLKTSAKNPVRCALLLLLVANQRSFPLRHLRHSQAHAIAIRRASGGIVPRAAVLRNVSNRENVPNMGALETKSQKTKRTRDSGSGSEAVVHEEDKENAPVETDDVDVDTSADAAAVKKRKLGATRVSVFVSGSGKKRKLSSTDATPARPTWHAPAPPRAPLGSGDVDPEAVSEWKERSRLMQAREGVERIVTMRSIAEGGAKHALPNLDAKKSAQIRSPLSILKNAHAIAMRELWQLPGAGSRAQQAGPREPTKAERENNARVQANKQFAAFEKNLATILHQLATMRAQGEVTISRALASEKPGFAVPVMHLLPSSYRKDKVGFFVPRELPTEENDGDAVGSEVQRIAAVELDVQGQRKAVNSAQLSAEQFHRLTASRPLAIRPTARLMLVRGSDEAVERYMALERRKKSISFLLETMRKEAKARMAADAK